MNPLLAQLDFTNKACVHTLCIRSFCHSNDKSSNLFWNINASISNNFSGNKKFCVNYIFQLGVYIFIYIDLSGKEQQPHAIISWLDRRNSNCDFYWITKLVMWITFQFSYNTYLWQTTAWRWILRPYWISFNLLHLLLHLCMRVIFK